MMKRCGTRDRGDVRIVWASFHRGLRESATMTAIVLGITMAGFGALAWSNDIGLLLTFLSTALIWALPGQLVLVESITRSVPLYAVVIGVGVANARFAPMCMAIAPHLIRLDAGLLKRAGIAQMMTATTWLAAMRNFPTMRDEEKVPYFTGFASANFIGCLIGTYIGYAFARSMPEEIVLGLVFLTPTFFTMQFACVKDRLSAIAIFCGVAIGPFLISSVPVWGLTLAGVLGGTLAIVLDTAVRRFESQRRTEGGDKQP